MHRIRRFATALALLLVAGPAAAQSTTLSGSVRDTLGTGVGDATISVQRIDNPFGGGSIVGTATSDAQGAYTITFAGDCALQCRISVSAPGRAVAPDLRIVGGSSSGQDFVAALPVTFDVRLETFDGATPVPGLVPFLAHRDPAQPALREDLGNGHWRFTRVFPAPLHLCAQADDDAYVGTCQGDQVMPFTNDFRNLPETFPLEGTTQSVVLRLRRGAELTGILVDAFRSTPIASTNIRLSLFDFPGTTTSTRLLRSDAQGRYRVPGLPPSAYRLQIAIPAPFYTPMRYPGLECLQPEDCLPDSGSYVSVNGGAVVDNLGFELTPGAILTGRVTDQATGAPLPGITVRAYQSQIFVGTVQVASATTDADGRYAVANIPLQFPARLGTANSAGYIDVGWPSVNCDTPQCVGGSPITVQSGVAATAYDFALAAGRAISGTISMPGVAPGALQGEIAIYRQGATPSQPIWTGNVEPGQSYLTRGFAAGTYFAVARVGGSCLVHAQQACAPGFAPDPATATPIVLPAATGTVPGVDFAFPPDPLFGSGFE